MELELLHLWPWQCDPPHGAAAKKAARIRKSIRHLGWQGVRLVGYRLEGRVQLLSGSHRWEACRQLGRKMPVVLVPLEAVHAAWGDLEHWSRIMEPWRDRSTGRTPGYEPGDQDSNSCSASTGEIVQLNRTQVS